MSHEVEHHVHESPKSMTVPLIILAIGSCLAGFLGVPHALKGENRFERFLEPVFVAESAAVPATHAKAEGEQVEQSAPAKEAEHANPVEYALMLASVAAAAVGLGLAYKAYKKAGPGFTEPINAFSGPLYRTLLNKWYVDELYDYTVLGRRPIGKVRLGAMGLGTAMWVFDANVIDGTVNGAGWTTRAVAWLSVQWDKYVIDGILVNGPAVVARLFSYPVRLVQWGLVQWYALVMVVGIVGFAFYYVLTLGH